MVPAGLNIAETMETGHIKNCGMTQEPQMFCEESLRKVNATDLELFSDDRNDMPCSSLFLLSGNDVISLESIGP